MTATDTRLAGPTPVVGRTTPPKHSFRPDIEGLRAVAIGLVLLYHAGVPGVDGGFVGVDVFFVISGFLITGLLVREVERTGRVRLGQFYARRAKRLLPASVLVLVATAIGTLVVFPVTQWREMGGDVAAAALYLVNWRFADRAVDYLAEGVAVSPVQHFWSLAVEEQFYIVWPLLLVLVTLALRRWSRLRVRPLMTVGLVLVAVPSFAWSVHLTATDPSAAFFVTTTRLWELAVGALVAIGATVWHRVPGRAASALGWLGLAAILGSAVGFGAQSAWPGHAALVPTLGTAAVIIAGASGVQGAGRLLAVRPMVRLGALSYSLYLWHWPMLVLVEAWRGGLGTRGALVVVAASFVPAALSLRFVENPIRFSTTFERSTRLTLSAGANLTLVGVLAGVALVLAVPSSSPTAARDTLGARAVAGADPEALWRTDRSDVVVPDPTEATEDLPRTYLDDCQAGLEAVEVATCRYGVPGADVTVALVGDSKALQWQPALDRVARDHGWQLVTYTKSDCTLTAPYGSQEDLAEASCTEWNDRVVEDLVRAGPDVVLVSGRARYPGGAEDPVEALAGLWAQRWQELIDSGIEVVALADNAHPGFEVYECVAQHPDELSACSFDRASQQHRSGGPAQRRAAELTDSPLVDMNDLVCPGSRCPAVIGDVLVYRQGSHLTRTFVESADGALAARLVPVVHAATGRGAATP
ncbi:acyltransferase family protein [Cellulomonas bogoriensis]|uniref:Acyltransferase n=1 Tax=Cellulomonas bogoriensis 69B4 = DSM 16987 TaxID=1386082 RepID=A0A0A0C015_9CELL|nr:acyltransferase family protein [Cellulomonas bogoriensis]KGM13252.1 acyltransferase [Cellulomonas bogoriensis 69B4 = DSM 16987]